MTEPNWLRLEEINFLHDQALEKHGGLSGSRPELIESALGRVQNQHAYGEEDLFKLGAGYADAVLRNHPFSDANKRTAFSAAATFLDKNGYELEPEKDKNHQDMILDLEQGRINKDQAADYLREHSRSLQQEESQSQNQENIQRRSARDIMHEQQNMTRDRGR